MKSKSQAKRVSIQKRLSNRFIVVYTFNYAVEPFKVVFDSSLKTFEGMDARVVAELFDRQPAEDSETRVFRLSSNITNDKFLYALNNGMEIVTIRQERIYEAAAKNRRRNKTSKVDR